MWPSFANPNGPYLGVGQTAFGNSQIRNDNDKYGARRSNTPSSYSETAAITNVFIKLRENCLIDTFLNIACTFMLVDTGSIQSTDDANYNTALWKLDNTIFYTNKRK